MENDLILSDKLLLRDNTVTYISNINGSCTWIDHCVASDSAHRFITYRKVLQDFIISDHRPLFLQVGVNCQVLDGKREENCDNTSALIKTNINWRGLSMDHKSLYHNFTKSKLRELKFPWEAVNCKDPLGEIVQHLRIISEYYTDLVSILQNGSY